MLDQQWRSRSDLVQGQAVNLGKENRLTLRNYDQKDLRSRSSRDRITDLHLRNLAKTGRQTSH